MTAYDASAWSDLFVAAAGASAALAGLLFVAVSINIDRILSSEGLPDRALQVLLQLLALVVVSLLALAPGQAPATLGIELLVVGLPLAVISFVLVGRALRAGAVAEGIDAARFERAALPRQLIVAAGTMPFIPAGLSMIAESGGGLYWVLAGLVLGLIGAVLNAWVLLVEILR